MMDYRLSDLLFIFFSLAIVYFLWRAKKNPFNLHIWTKLGSMPKAQISLAFLFIFWLFAFMDCLHFVANHTLLDSLLAPLGQIQEYSYSKPFAWMTLQPQMRMLNHKFILEPMHLSYVPAIIRDQAMVLDIIYKQCTKIILIMTCFTVLLLCLFKTKLKSIRPFVVTLLMIITAVLMILSLSKYFHVLGTNQIGQDVFYQSLKSIRTALIIGLFTSMIILPFALSLGLMAGYFGGMLDYVIQYIYTVISSIPSVLLISASLLAWQFFAQTHITISSASVEAENRLLVICLLLGLTNWAGLCRYIRAEVLKLRELDFIKAARLLRSSSFKILFEHLLPNILHLVIISIVLDFSALVLAESVLTYIGIGVSPLTISWGNMINAARMELARDPVIWWPLLGAFGFMFTLVLACNFFADALRKALNPRE